MQRKHAAPAMPRRPHKPRTGKRARDDDVVSDAAAQASATTAQATTAQHDDDDRDGGSSGDVAMTTTTTTTTTTQPKAKLQSSAFATQRAMLRDADAIAAYVRQHHATHFRTSKQLATFLQAVGGRSPALYAQLCARHKREVTFLLDRLYAHASLAASPSTSSSSSSTRLTLSRVMTPHAHEFVLRCEACGVHKATWSSTQYDDDDAPQTHNGDDAATTTTTTPARVDSHAAAVDDDGALPALFTSRELVTRLRALDPVGRAQRMIELCQSTHDVARCTRRLQRILDAQHEDKDDDGDDNDAATTTKHAHNDNDDAQRHKRPRRDDATTAAARVVEMHTALANKRLSDKTGGGSGSNGGARGGSSSIHDYATQCRLVSKLMSKIRRVVTAARTSHDDNDNNGDNDNNDNIDNKVDGDETAAAVRELTADERAALQTCVTRIVAMVEHTLQRRAADGGGGALSPIAKCVHFARWCNACDLLADNDAARLVHLEARATRDSHAQAAQLETVLRLKALPHVTNDDSGTSSAAATATDAHAHDTNSDASTTAAAVQALTSLLDELWHAGNDMCFVPHSADVLSSIATAASAPHVPAAVRADVADRLAQTHQYLLAQHERNNNNNKASSHGGGGVAAAAAHTPPPQLPRRALRLVQAVQQERKRVARARQLAADAAAEAHTA